MNFAEQISIPLKRKIYNGSRYSKFLPKSTCQTSNLGNGENTIAEGVNFMAQKVKEWAHQTEKLTKALGLHKILQEKGIPATVAVVYGFLYTHIQYSADWQMQNLRSPACSWYARKLGIDCKSYSIFAACILENLGLNYSIRRVKQPGSHPDLWSHVYIAVPLDQTSDTQQQLDEKKYLVIDATKHENSEVAYLDKHDTIMQKHKYVAMNAATGTVANASIPAKVKNSLLQLKNSFKNNFGFSEEMASRMIATIEAYLLAGVSSNDVLVSPPPSDSLQAGKGIIIGTRQNPTEFQLFPFPKRGLGAIDFNWGNGSSASSDGYDVDTQEIVNSVTNSGFWNNTFGAIFANGMNLSCWGATLTPQEAQEQVSKDAPAIIQKSGLNSGSFSVQKLNRFAEMTSAYMARRLVMEKAFSSSCSSDASRAAYEGMKKFRDQIINQVKTQLQSQGFSLELVRMADHTELTAFNMPLVSGSWKGGGNYGSISSQRLTKAGNFIPIYKIIGEGKPNINLSPVETRNTNFDENYLNASINFDNQSPYENSKKATTGTKVLTAGAGAAFLLLVGPKILETLKKSKN